MLLKVCDGAVFADIKGVDGALGGVGVDNVAVPAATKRKIPVVVRPYANSTTVAEFAVGSILALTKKLFPTNAVLKDGTYTGSHV